MVTGKEGVLFTPRLLIRPLDSEDGPLIVKWRNQSYIREVSRTDRMLTIAEHERWFRDSREKRLDFIFSDRGSKEAIGLVSFELSYFEGKLGQHYELSKYIGNQAYMGRGLAYEVCEKLLTTLENEGLVSGVFAITRRENTSNIRLNIKLGFSIVDGSQVPGMDASTYVCMVKSFT